MERIKVRTDEFVREGIERVKAPTPKWFKWLRWGAGIVAGASGTIATVLTQPWSTVVIIIGGIAIGITGTTFFPTVDKKVEEAKDKAKAGDRKQVTVDPRVVKRSKRKHNKSK